MAQSYHQRLHRTPSPNWIANLFNRVALQLSIFHIRRYPPYSFYDIVGRLGTQTLQESAPELSTSPGQCITKSAESKITHLPLEMLLHIQSYPDEAATACLLLTCKLLHSNMDHKSLKQLKKRNHKRMSEISKLPDSGDIFETYSKHEARRQRLIKEYGSSQISTSPRQLFLQLLSRDLTDYFP